MRMDDLARELELALRGLDYPAPRGKLIFKAMENMAPPAVFVRLKELPESADFRTPEQLRDAIGVFVPATRPQRGWQ